MSHNIILTIIEFVASIIVEGVILAGIFNYLSNKAQQAQDTKLKMEMNNIETQNKFIFEQLQTEIKETKLEVISQIKETGQERNDG
jgi:hypothetical protein